MAAEAFFWRVNPCQHHVSIRYGAAAIRSPQNGVFYALVDGKPSDQENAPTAFLNGPEAVPASVLKTGALASVPVIETATDRHAAFVDWISPNAARSATS